MRLAQGFHGRVLQGQEVLASQTLTQRAHALHKRSQYIRLFSCTTRMTAALRQPLLPCRPTAPHSWSLLPLSKPTVRPSSSSWRAVIDDLRGCCSPPEATEAALVSFEVDRSCLDGLWCPAHLG